MREPLPATKAALAWLTHPVTCLALVLLIVNDHILKAMYGTWWTGKLSDVAWLVVGPPLLAMIVAGAASLVGRRNPSARTCTRMSLAVVGVVFVLVKSTAVGAAVASASLTPLAGPSVVLRDPTDLWALPAVALAWVVARATWTSARSATWPRARSTIGWLVLLPVAVLATTATSQMQPTGTMEVAVVSDVLIVGQSTWTGSASANWYSSEDGSTWDDVYLSSAAAKQFAERFKRNGGTRKDVCVPASPSQCFRVADHGVGVDLSDDGGRTWRADWSIPDELLADLAQRYQPKGMPLRTVGVAVMPSPDGFRVYAADGGDGLAVRDEQGAWQRLGFTYQTNGPPVIPLPTEPTPMAYPIPWSVMVGVLAALATLALSGRRSRLGPPPGRVLGGRITALGAAIALGLAALANKAWGVVDGQQLGSDIILGPLMPVAIVGALTLLAAGPTVVASGLLRRRLAALLIDVTGVGVALVVELVAPLRLAEVVAIAILGAGIAAARLAPHDPYADDGGLPMIPSSFEVAPVDDRIQRFGEPAYRDVLGTWGDDDSDG
jgi:hypothetical protein